jgi:ABC-type bacteriocin/lantibiotic exporter with double-glycine peptidase domain
MGLSNIVEGVILKYWLKWIAGVIIALLITWGLVVLFNKYNTLLVLFILWQAWRIDTLEKLVKSKIERHEETHAKIYAAMDRLQERTEAKEDRLCDRLSELEDDNRKLKRQNNFYDDSDRYKYD